MMKTVRWLILAWLILFAAGIAYDAWRRPGTLSIEKASAAAGPKEPGEKSSIWVGSPSCIGRSCHGGIEPFTGGGCLQNEYLTIAANDPHSRAYDVLKNGRSQAMVRALGRADGKAHEEKRCLACHATAHETAPGATIKAAETFFGVGCESCHGPAASWVYDHFGESKWKAKAALVPLAARAALCADCHVGAPSHAQSGERNVDHDLIAAGHPRLLFEFVSLQSAMPAHWRETRRDTTYEWFIGQIAGARAVLDLLDDRAKNSATPWPEFAEFDCFACHHDLQQNSWRQKITPGGNAKRSAIPWDSWTYSVISRLLQQHGLPTDDWDRLRDEMQRFIAFDRKTIVPLVARARARLDDLKNHEVNWHRNKAGSKNLFDLLSRPDWETASSWEAAEQFYFALLALKASNDEPALAARIANLEVLRGFDSEYTSPRRFDPKRFFEKARQP